mgnify:CR=1 FL=1
MVLITYPILSVTSPFSSAFAWPASQLTATTDAATALAGADYVIVATPTNYDPVTNHFDTRSVEAAINEVNRINPAATIVITFAVSAFLLALIYRSWQLGQADTVVDDEADREVRERAAADEDTMDDEITDEDDDATTDFIGTETAPIRVLHHRDFDGIRDDAPTDRPRPSSGDEGEGGMPR